jgi:hypothetical protein
VHHAQSLALYPTLATCSHVNQQVNEMVLQEVDLIDIEKALVSLGE